VQDARVSTLALGTNILFSIRHAHSVRVYCHDDVKDDDFCASQRVNENANDAKPCAKVRKDKLRPVPCRCDAFGVPMLSRSQQQVRVWIEE
jgi:hypothetical protein